MNQSLDFPSTRGVPAFRISGAFYHKIGSLQNRIDEVPRLLQCYFHESEVTPPHLTNEIRSHWDNVVLLRIMEEIRAHNSFFSTMKLMLENDDYQRIPLYQIVISDKPPPEASTRTYNRPTCVEVSAIILGSEPEQGNQGDRRELFIQNRDNNGTLRYISDNHSAYDPLAYTLTHMHGEKGWTYDIPRSIGDGIVSVMDFYGFRIQVRDNPQSNSIVKDAILFGGLLFQQYLCDMYVKMESQRLRWLRFNQTKIRSELYKGLADAVASNDVENAGTATVLPSSFTGGPRHQHASFQDALAIARKLKKAALFVTMTCNADWPEIKRSLRGNQPAWKRPDITNRVFKMRLSELVKDIKQKKIFGETISIIYVIEFQKRGLPHAHILITLAEAYSPTTADDYDAIVSAEIPDPIKNEKLYNIIVSNMMHGPCGGLNMSSPCMQNDLKKCSKGYPKPLNDTTKHAENSFPVYRRRGVIDGGRTYQKSPQHPMLDNGWVVPYNPWCSMKYCCHINVEICNSISAYKYLYKYVYKGDDKASVNVVQANPMSSHVTGTVDISGATRTNEDDEISKFVDARYVGANNAHWKLLGYEMEHRDPCVMRLQIHDENCQRISFEEGREAEALREADGKHTMLTGYFARCTFEENNPLTNLARGTDKNLGMLYPVANDLTYLDFCTYYTWNKRDCAWTRRKRSHKSNIVSRIFVVPLQTDKFYLRMLLCKVAGATSFQNLKLFEGTSYDTYKQAARARGYISDDDEWMEYFDEQCHEQSPRNLRNSFIFILNYNVPTNAKEIWEKYKDYLTEDFTYVRSRSYDAIPIEEDYVHCLYCLNEYLMQISEKKKSLWPIKFSDHTETEHFYFEKPECEQQGHLYEEDNTEMREALNYNVDEQNAIYEQFVSIANEDQLNVLQTIICPPPHLVERHMFFVDAPGGTGKTTLFKAILAHYRSKRKIAIAVSSSGISAILLPGGRTVHSRFKIPLNLYEESELNIRKNSNVAKMIYECEVIIFDEAAMLNRLIPECIDRYCKTLMSSPALFGGKKIIMGGDFRQVLPVIKREGRAGVVNKCLKKSYLWNSFVKLKLTVNQRLRGSGADEYQRFLLSVGEGRASTQSDTSDDVVILPDDIVFKANEDQTESLHSFVDYIYPELTNDEECLNEDIERMKAILTPKNSSVDEINAIALKKLQGDIVQLESSDELMDGDGMTCNIPVEYLNSVQVSGLPPHLLQLKKSAPVMLLRNVNYLFGLANGTRLEVLNITRRCLTLRVKSGTCINDKVVLPRIDLIPTDTNLPFDFKRRQFPIKLAYAMTINKAQGQSLERVGIYLPSPCFSHGQLYVALSRASNPQEVKVLVSNIDGQQGMLGNKTFTKNVVYREVI